MKCPQHKKTVGAFRPLERGFETFFAFDLALAQWTGGQTRALGTAPPAQPGEGKAPEDRFIFVEQNDLALARAVLQGSEVDRAIGEVGRGGIEPPGGTAGFDHGAGHPLLLLCNVKAPNY